nr:hypothetical protein [Kibdelosporangium sp. MJ126-NF4]CTQ89389.1 hypothetical protein [Kibdelosporangium sp. MJ126-NF4]
MELTRQQLSETVDELVHKLDLRQRARPVLQTVMYYRVPIALFALSLAVTLLQRRK